MGLRKGWQNDLPFGLYPKDRLQHLYVIGKTGTGKSTLLRNMQIQDIVKGEGMSLIDPHGDLAEDLLNSIPPQRIKDTIYFDPSDFDKPIGFNLLEKVPRKTRPLVASGIVSAFKSIWRDSWGPRLEYVLYLCLAALLECEDVSLLGLQRMLYDAAYRTWVINQIKDPLLKVSWEKEIGGFNKTAFQEAVSPIQNKAGQLFASPAIRNILGQVKSKISIKEAMDKRMIFLANLSKGKIGEDKANLLGSLLLTKFQVTAMERAYIQEADRVHHYLYVDEFGGFTSNSFASILSEARKYKLGLTLSHQYSEQVVPEIQEAIFGNVGSLVSFRVGKTDAEKLEREFGGSYQSSQFLELNNFEAICKMMNNQTFTFPFRAKMLAPIDLTYDHAQAAIKQSRMRYGTARKKVESKFQRWIKDGSRPQVRFNRVPKHSVPLPGKKITKNAFDRKKGVSRLEDRSHL